MEVTGRVCNKCGKIRPLAHFYRHRLACKLCVTAQVTDYRRANYAHVRALEIKRQQTPHYREVKAARKRAARAEKRGAA